MKAAGAFNGLPRALRKRVWPHAHESHKANATAHFALGANAVLDMTAGAKPTPATITTRHLANELAEQHQLSKKQGLEMMEELIGMITKHLKKGERVRIAGLGILQVRKRAARMGRNPATGQQIHIKASKKVAFRATKELRMAI
jgi:DNA-binding protein HU-beta